jgi:hypothetical protein
MILTIGPGYRNGLRRPKVSMAIEPMTETFRLPKAAIMDAVSLRSAIGVDPWIRTKSCMLNIFRRRP